jgi:hypothetical protein
MNMIVDGIKNVASSINDSINKITGGDNPANQDAASNDGNFIGAKEWTYGANADGSGGITLTAPDPSTSNSKDSKWSGGKEGVGHYHEAGWRADGTPKDSNDPTPGSASASGDGSTPDPDAEAKDTSFAGRMKDYLNAQGELTGDMAEKLMNDIINDPSSFLTDGMKLADAINMIDPNAIGTTIDPNDPRFFVDIDGASVKTEVAGDATTVTAPSKKDPNTYESVTTYDKIGTDATTVDPITGKVEDRHLVDAKSIEIDMEGAATGINKDGSKNFTGEALKDYATLTTSTVIDTSTLSGKLLAMELGEGNYVDSKATVQGQLAAMEAHFKDANGNPKIPAFASALARNVSRTMAFQGVTGTAAIDAMSTALMEASVPIATEFFQTITLTNLDNKQEAIINKAKVLSRFEEVNANAREAAAINNAKTFLEMDLTNLTAENEAEVINVNNRIQSLFEDARSKNAERLFTADAKNDFVKFYDEMSLNAQTYNASASDAMKQFNVGEINDNNRFNAELKTRREEFYKTMQFNIEKAVADWRQTVTLTNNANQFEAQKTDVQNLLGIKTAGLSRVWDHTDSILNLLATFGEADIDREIALAEIAQSGKNSRSSALGGLLGTLAAGIIRFNPFNWSDINLKKNIKHIGTYKDYNIYEWKWNNKAKELGIDTNPTIGVIAQEVEKINPNIVRKMPNGFLAVNYGEMLNGF